MSCNVLVTGGAGYLGSILVPALLAAGHKVTVLDNFMWKQNSLAACCADPAFDVINGDVRSEATVRPLLAKADVVIPLAALVGAPLAILLAGDAPYARIYVPEPLRANVKVGDKVRVLVDGRDGALAGSIRMIRSEPSFTPYYALIGEDAARLSYLAEVALGKDAARLPAGLPLRVEFDGR